MEKTNDKFCPDCGHHLYEGAGDPAYPMLYCADCQTFHDYSADSLDDVLALRERYDAQAETDA